MSILDEQVVVSGSNVHAACLQGFLVFDVYDVKLRYVLQQRRKQIVPMTTAMLYNEQRYVEVTGQSGKQLAQRCKAAP